MDIQVYGVDLVRIIFRSAFAHGTQASLQLHGVGAISYNSRPHLVLLQGKGNSARYIAQVISVLLPFLREEGDVLFQQDNTRPHTAAAMQNALHGVQLP